MRINDLTVKEILNLFKQIPEEDDFLDLHGNGLGFRKTEELIEIIKGIPPHIHHLHLGSNSLGVLTGYKYPILVDMLQVIPDYIISLNLSSNVLGAETTISNLVMIMKKIPESIKMLNLNWNHIRKNSFWSNKTDDQMFEIVIAIPKSVEKLEFLGNGIDASYDSRNLTIIKHYYPSFICDGYHNDTEQKNQNTSNQFFVRKPSNFSTYSMFSIEKIREDYPVPPLQEQLLEGFIGFQN